jgi:large subunit ribosomal protein L16
MYQPKILKPKKSHKGKNFRKIVSVNSLSYGNTKLISLETGILSSNHFKVIKFTIKKFIKKKGSVLVIKYPQVPVTKKPLEVRMGKGKGAINFWTCRIGLGCLLCKIETFNTILAIKSLLSLQNKLPIRTKIVTT